MRGIRPRQPIHLPALHLRPQPPLFPRTRPMSSQREDSIPHELRTAAEPRQNRLYPVHLAHVEQVNRSIRLLQFTIPSPENGDQRQPFSFMPGQWLDVHIPSISNAGGFTITSTPADAQALPSLDDPDASVARENVAASLTSQGRAPYVELAVQDSPSNPAAAWLWKPKNEIIGKEVNIRVGGSFVWPPTGIDVHAVKNVVLIAGGVGINPLISILSHMNQTKPRSKLDVHILYSSRLPQGQETEKPESVFEQILFLPRVRHIISSHGPSCQLNISLDLFLTSASATQLSLKSPADLNIHSRRISDHDLYSALVSGSDKVIQKETVAYVCGPPVMTDELVEKLQGFLEEDGTQRVFFEKWW
ncbi:uncharacterized protein N7484_011199 [Penicillium longicatenatum]|uniref:uncharacterized protein n=1 Tax=Penicillium longicatenatum TaxID=1561947 RepID=UPI002548FE95|nr:uncharacterized protein N7484_011199 [Penicillium longicatenatum]KAJ5631099.1 hypothetical protein N7484_011199 [Penicillium longicatenatum]